MPVDLHVHTIASDGGDAPEEIVRKALDIGLEAVAITDHDTISGIAPAVNAARGTGLEVVPGIEINTDYREREVHILGYFIENSNPQFLEGVDRLARGRVKRITAMVQKLRDMGLQLTPEEVFAVAGPDVVGRLHVAQVLVNRNIVSSIGEAFEKYIGRGRPGYVPRTRFSPVEAVQLIRAGGGVPVLAHPGTIGNDEIIGLLIPYGLRGIEVYHPEHTGAQVRHYLYTARKLGLIATGGSDYHRPGYRADLGEVCVPREVVRRLQEVARSLQERRSV